MDSRVRRSTIFRGDESVQKGSDRLNYGIACVAMTMTAILTVWHNMNDSARYAASYASSSNALQVERKREGEGERKREKVG